MPHMLLVICSSIAFIVILFGIDELIYRNIRIKRTIIEAEPFFSYSATLGWVPKPGSWLDFYGNSVNITSKKFRRTQPPTTETGRSRILVLGDSFAFCAAVSDLETWPYYLSEKLGVEVVNAGVNGYGFDQTILRMEEITDQVKPDLIIISVIYQDVVNRCELRYRHQHKPYFDVINDTLVLKNQPVPSLIEDPWKPRWYEHSFILHDLVQLITGNRMNVNEIRVHNKGMLVGRHLVGRAKRFAAERKIPLMILVQVTTPEPDENDRRYMNELEAIILKQEVPVQNLLPRMLADYPDVIERKKLFDDHMTGLGNKWVSEKVAEFISNRLNFEV